MAAQEIFSSIAVTNTVELVSGETCIVRMYDTKNRDSSADVNVQLFDARKVSDVVLGTTKPKLNYTIPQGGGLFFSYDKTQGPQFDRGLCIAVTATPHGLDAPGTSPTINIMLQGNLT